MLGFYRSMGLLNVLVALQCRDLGFGEDEALGGGLRLQGFQAQFAAL